jgi:hypothetical protein
MSEEELCEQIFKLEKENRQLQNLVDILADRIKTEHPSRFKNIEMVKNFYGRKAKRIRTCSGIDQTNCQEEKMSCDGCYYNQIVKEPE